MLTTERLVLIPHSYELLQAEIHDHAELSRLLNASVPSNWPPESTIDALPFFLSCAEAAAGQIGWFGWYAVAKKTAATRSAELVGGGGFMGPPTRGSAQVGYSVIDQHQGSGYATELLKSLIQWALLHSQCDVIVAETEWANPASVRVLEKCGFSRIGPPSQGGGSRFQFPAGGVGFLA
jgi:RimJ/RimL family protein N-acetyltransferase